MTTEATSFTIHNSPFTIFKNNLTKNSIMAKARNPQGRDSNQPPDDQLAEAKRTTNGNDYEYNMKIGNQDDAEAVAVRLTPSTGRFRSTPDLETDKKLWDLIDERTVDFNKYFDLMNEILRTPVSAKVLIAAIPDPSDIFPTETDRKIAASRMPFHSSGAYSLLKFATERFVQLMVDLDIEDDTGTFPIPESPYLKIILRKLTDFKSSFRSRFDDSVFSGLRVRPFLLELIWSYWHEEGMQVQTMNALARRFQNIRSGAQDPLANLELDPLRPMNNILWGYIQDAQHRLTVSRRAYEYDHHYGIKLIGKAIPNFSPADSRSQFISAFHNLLYRAIGFYKDADDLTRRADGFPILNALKEVHLLLAEGAHNQFGDLPATARVEMLIEQWILSQPEIREFLGGRVMVPYDEPWMDRVDTMKALQGWPNTSVKYYHDLAKYGEQLLLSIRWTNWTQVNDRDFAAAWATAFRDAIQRYVHCYHAVTGMDLGIDTVESTGERKAIMPALLIQQKFLRERSYRR